MACQRRTHLGYADLTSNVAEYIRHKYDFTPMNKTTVLQMIKDLEHLGQVELDEDDLPNLEAAVSYLETKIKLHRHHLKAES